MMNQNHIFVDTNVLIGAWTNIKAFKFSFSFIFTSLIRVGRNLCWRTPGRQNWIVFVRHIKKKRGNQLLLIPLSRLSHRPVVKDKQCISPRFWYHM